jgi:secreted trypsin-like serine protease
MTAEEALQYYAMMINTLDASCLEPHLTENFCYSSQKVLTELTSKQAFIHYIRGKLSTLQASGHKVFAEIGVLEKDHPIGPCVLLAEGNQDGLVAVVLAKTNKSLIERLDLCIVPTVQSVTRTGIYPGLKN